MKDFIVIGGGQAGLSIAYYLKKQGQDFLVVDANSEVGAPWLKRWDSLKLFTPSEFNNLPGFPFPHKKGHYASKYDVADYLKQYVSTFDIPITFNEKITTLKKEGSHFVLKSEDNVYKAKNVIVSTGPFHTPFIPPCHSKIADPIFQIHSEYYKNANQLQDGDTLVVGAGDSGVQILKDISETNRTVYFSGTTNIATLPQEILGKTLWWWFKKIGFLTVTKYSWIGKKLVSGRQPVIGTNVKKLFKKSNIHCVGRTLDANKHDIVFEEKTISSIKNIIWATGFKPNFEWIENEQLDTDNYPKNYRGVSTIEGLYYLGLPWLHTRGSATLGGVKNDAKYLSQYILKTRPSINTAQKETIKELIST
jgi:putative flavoprotein involved in K+ transport